MISAITVHLEGIKTAFTSRLAYRGDFIISLIIMLMVEFLMPMITILIYKNGAAFPGWNMYEVLLIQSIFLLSKGIAYPFFFGMVWNTLNRVREGTLELVLIKPRSVLHMLIITVFDCEDIGKFFGGIALFTISIYHLPAPHLFQWLQFFALFVLAIVTMFGFALILSGLTIIWIGNSRVYEIFQSISNFGMYPIGIFSKPVQVSVSMIFPVAMMGFIPAAALLGKASDLTIYSAFAIIAFLFASLGFFKLMLKRYTSAGG